MAGEGLVPGLDLQQPLSPVERILLDEQHMVDARYLIMTKMEKFYTNVAHKWLRK